MDRCPSGLRNWSRKPACVKTYRGFESHPLRQYGELAQLGERLICIQEVRSSILLGSTKLLLYCGCSSGVERFLAKENVVSSNLTIRSNLNGLLVKWLIRLPVTQKIAGSIPAQVAIVGD